MQISNVSFHAQSFYSNRNNSFSYSGSSYAQDYAINSEDTKETSISKNKEFRNLLRTLNSQTKTMENPYAVKSEDIVNSLYGSSDTEDTDTDDLAIADVKYNYKEVTNKVLRAKTSKSAGNALLAAKRKVNEIRRKMSCGAGNAKELQLALTHAKRIELAAKKKKHHLEIEELIERTSKSDENNEKAKDLRSSLINSAEEKLSMQEDNIFEERSKIFDESIKEMEENNQEITDEFLIELNDSVSKIGEEVMEKLEETIEQLEAMEVANPHMSEEDYKELKIKHRNSENKAITKADMDYLKDMISSNLNPFSYSESNAMNFSAGENNMICDIRI